MPSLDDNEDRWIRRFHPSPTGGVRLVCFPHAGGSASYYFPMSASMPPGIDVMAVQYPGRQDRRHEPLVDNISDLAEEVCKALDGTLDGPFAFFGHSMGAILAFEVAQRIQQRKGLSPVCFFASGRRAPSRQRSGSVHLLDDAGLLAELRNVGGTDRRLLQGDELMATILPAIRNDYRAIESYAWTPAPPLKCPATVLVGGSDPQTTLDEAAAWREHFTGSFDLQAFPGGHFYLEAASAKVIELISAALSGIRTFEGSSS
jgi:pyochelin biosynthetic protein PchC